MQAPVETGLSTTVATRKPYHTITSLEDQPRQLAAKLNGLVRRKQFAQKHTGQIDQPANDRQLEQQASQPDEAEKQPEREKQNFERNRSHRNDEHDADDIPDDVTHNLQTPFKPFEAL